MAHDDGSLTAHDSAILSKHIQGIRIIRRSEADDKLASILKNFPRCRQYRKTHVNALQLFDVALLSDTGTIIAVDADTLFLKSPKRMIDWIQNNERSILHYAEEFPFGQREFLDKLGYAGYAPRLSFGYVCFYKDIIDLKHIEHVLGKMNDIDWCTNQNMLASLIKEAHTRYAEVVLDQKDYQDVNNFQNGAIFRHYQASVTFQLLMDLRALKTFQQDTQQVLDEIRKRDLPSNSEGN